jgi:hypothetical protein
MTGRCGEGGRRERVVSVFRFAIAGKVFEDLCVSERREEKERR